MAHEFGHKKPRHCSCCGDRIVLPDGRTLPEYRLIHLLLSNGSRIPLSLCADCVSEPWTPERMTAVKAQMDDAYRLSARGQFYVKTDADADTWEIRQVATPLPADVAQREVESFVALHITGVDEETPVIQPEVVRIVT